MKEILDIIHKTIYQFFDVCGDNEEVPVSDKDKLLLEVNKAICNNLKALEQHPTCDSCKYYTHRNACRESKNYCYCNRVTTTKMLPDDYCSRWEGKTDDE